MIGDGILIRLVGNNERADKNLPNHSEICKTTKHNLAGIRTPVASRIVDHQIIPNDTCVYLTSHQPFWSIVLMNPANQDTWFAYGVELGTRRWELAWRPKISCGDDGGGGDGLDLPPVRRHVECDLDLSARLSGNQDGLTYYEI